MFGERERYGRRSVREQLEEPVAWLRSHWPVVALAAVVAAVLLTLALMAQPVPAQDLRVGDCLYIRTAAAEESGPGARPIGDEPDVISGVLAGIATRTWCNLSHGHEVAVLVPFPRAENPRGLPIVAERACRDGAGAYLDRAIDLSIYEAYLAMPSAEQWDAGIRDAICLVARRDGQWMDHPAANSGE